MVAVGVVEGDEVSWSKDELVDDRSPVSHRLAKRAFGDRRDVALFVQVLAQRDSCVNF